MADVLVGPHPPRWRTIRTIARNGGRYLFGSALRNWARNLGSTAPALGSMALLLLLLGVAALGGVIAHNVTDLEARDASVLHVYLDDNATPAQVDSLEMKLRADRDVVKVTYISKEQALARAQHRPGLPELAAAAESNPFPAGLDVQVTAIDRVGAVDRVVRRDPSVDGGVPSSYDPNAYKRFQAIILGLAVGGAAFLILLLFIAVTVTANSIRSAIISRADEIGIMQLVGAPRWMVRGPFVIEGALTGAVAGGLAGIAAFGLCVVGVQAGAASFAQIAPGLTIQAGLVISLLLLVIGPVLGSASSLGSVRRHLES